MEDVRIGLIRFLYGWRKRRPEPSYSFIRFGFAHICSLHCVRFLCCSYICFARTSQLKKDRFFWTSQSCSEMTCSVLIGTLNPTIPYHLVPVLAFRLAFYSLLFQKTFETSVVPVYS